MYQRSGLALIAAWFLVIAASGLARAATITGRVVLPDGRPVGERFVYGSAKAPSTSHAYDYIGSGDNGYYTLSNVSTGTWAVGAVDPQYIRAEIRHVEVTNASGTYTVNFNLQSTYYAPDDNWPTDPKWRWVSPDAADYAQSFVATGPSVVRATIRNAEWGAAQPIVLSVRQGGPTGTQIGPSRTVESGAGHGEASWAGGEIPVVPGQTYYLRARAQDINDNWAPGQGYPPYPNGQLYINGVAQPDIDMSWSISCDDDGYATSYYVHRYKWAAQLGSLATEWGQTFIARSYDIQMATAHLGSGGTTSEVDFSIHEFNTGTQAVGAQIGPTKTATLEKEEGRDQSGGALWSPGEVRVTPGQTYYLRVRLQAGGQFQLYRFSDRYPHGNSWRDGVKESGWDLESQILGTDEPFTETTTSPSLPVGWNMISLPLEPSDGNPPVVFAGINIDNRLYRYVTGVGYKVYRTATPADFGGDVRQGEGYWLYLDTSKTISYEGMPQTGTQTVSLPAPGWALIGHPQKTSTALADCQVYIAPSGTPISLAQADTQRWLDLPLYWFNPVSRSYTVIGFDPWQASIFDPWRGYWVWVAQSNLRLLVP